MVFDSDGLVIKAQPTGEQDRLVTLLTRTNGVIRAFANGARNPKNKNAAATSLLCYADFTIAKSAKGVFTIRESTPKDTFFSLQKDLVRLSLAQYFAQLSLELAPREEEASQQLNLLLNAIYLLSASDKQNELIKAATELRLLSLAGYMPDLIACANCGAYETDEMKFCHHSGRLYCENCTPKEPFLSAGVSVIHAMRHICLSDPGKVFSFRLSEDSVLQLDRLSEAYLHAVTGKRFETLQFYKTMTR